MARRIPASVARGSVCWLPYAEAKSHFEVNRHGYVVQRCADVVQDVEALFSSPLCRRIVWVESGGTVKGFHPATPITQIRSVVKEIAYQGCLF